MSESPAKEPIMGVCIFGEPVSGKTYDEVLAAARVAGIPEELVTVLRPRHAFIRACQELAKDATMAVKFRDKWADNSSLLGFNFVVHVDSVQYAVECSVQYDKNTHAVEVLRAPAGVSTEEVKAKALDLMLRARTYWQASDINALVKRFVKAHAKRVPLRAGVSFLPVTAITAATAVQRFYAELDVPFFTLPVGLENADNAKNIHRAIISQMAKEVAILVAEIKELKSDGNLSKRVARGKIKELHVALRQYRDLARDTRIELEAVFESAGQSANIIRHATMSPEMLLGEVRAGRPVESQVLDLFEAAESYDETTLISLRFAALPLPAIGIGDDTSSSDELPLVHDADDRPLPLLRGQEVLDA